MTSTKRYLRIALAAAFSAAVAAGSSLAADVDGARVQNADKELEKGNWLTYHGSYKSWHYSPLDQINTKTVGKLSEAWSHTASRANRGLQGFPLAIDGILYYSSPYNQVYALDGATGQMLWTYKQKLNEDLVARQTHSPYNRGIAAGYGNIFIGTLDGKLAASATGDRGDGVSLVRELAYDGGMLKRPALWQRPTFWIAVTGAAVLVAGAIVWVVYEPEIRSNLVFSEAVAP